MEKLNIFGIYIGIYVQVGTLVNHCPKDFSEVVSPHSKYCSSHL